MTTLSRPPQLDAAAKADLIRVSHAMLEAGLPESFVTNALETAFQYEGVCDLMRMWREEAEDQVERDAIVADLQELIEDCAKAGYTEGAYIRFDDLEAIAANIQAFKDNLRLIVDDRGGIGKLAELTSIPQPSLSRFFATPSMPHRSTLLKIAKALDLSEVEIATPWAR